MAATTKTCRKCHVDRALSEFGAKRSSPDGLQPQCKFCDLAYREARAAMASTTIAPSPATPAGKLTTPETDFRPNREVLATFAAGTALVRDGMLAPNMLWIGPSGSGKTEQARDLARRAGLPFFKVDAPAITDPEAWFGTREVRVRDGAPETVYNPSVFATALTQRCILLVDEGNRVSDAIRGILLALWDDSREATNPLTGQTIKRHPECYVVMTANVGLAFTGTYAIDPAFYTRATTTRFGYLDAAAEAAVARSRTGCAPEVAELFVRFANETRQRNALSEDFPPISTREVITASALVSRGLDINVAAHQVMINAAPSEGGPESIQGQLEMIWTGIRAIERPVEDEADELDRAVTDAIVSVASMNP